MAFPRSLLPLMALVALGSAGLVAAQQPLVPAFVWGNTEHLACGSTGQTNRVVYETLDGEFLAGDMMSGMMGKGATGDAARFVSSQAKPEVTTIFLGSKLQTTDLSRLAGTPEMQPLQDAVSAAKSSISLPYTSLSAGQEGFLSKVSQTVGDGELHVVGSCGANGTSLAPGDVAAAVASAAAGEAQVLVLCAQDAPALAEEMALLSELMGALEESQKEHMVMYLSDVVPSGRPAPRLLQEVSAAKDYTKCDGECMSFVYAIEAGIVLLIVLVAVLTGMACHNMLDAPSKFETPPKSD